MRPLVLLLCVPWLWLGCEVVNTGKKFCGTQITDPCEGLAGSVVTETGEPAILVNVQLIPSTGALSKQAQSKKAGATEAGSELRFTGEIDTSHDYKAITDEFGNYEFKNPPQGAYDLFFSNDKRASIRKEVYVNSMPYYVGKDMIKPYGWVAGTIVDGELKTPIDSASCAILNRPFHSGLSTASGQYVLYAPAGVYEVTCQKTPYREVTQTKIRIESGKPTSLNFELEKGNPENTGMSPASLTAVYDSVTGMVRLTWPKVAFSDFAYYGIKRVDPNKFPDAPIFFPTETTYSDLVYKERSDSSVKDLYYSVTSYRTDGSSTIWVQAPMRLRVSPPAKVGADINLNFATGDSLLVVGATLKAVVDYKNYLRMSTKLIWTLAGTLKDSSEVLKKDTLSIASLSGTAIYSHVCDVAGKWQLRVTLEDEMGVSNSAFLKFEVNKP